MVKHIMNAMLDLVGKLLIAAKALAARRRITRKAMVEHALRREIAPQEKFASDSPCEVGPFRILSLKKRPEGLAADQVWRLIDRQHGEEDGRIISSFTVRS